jgi:VanZ family protein
VRRVLFLFALAAIAFMSLLPRADLDAHVPPEVQSRASLIHFVSYLALGACALWSRGRRRAPWRSLGTAVAFCGMYGIAMECLQMLPVVGRSCSASDVAQNLAGAAVAALCTPTWLWPASRLPDGQGDDTR